jgi:hypothetical protein
MCVVIFVEGVIRFVTVQECVKNRFRVTKYKSQICLFGVEMNITPTEAGFLLTSNCDHQNNLSTAPGISYDPSI